MYSSFYIVHSIYKIVRDAYNTLVDGLAEKVDATKEDVKKMIWKLSIDTGVEIPGIRSSNIPLNPKKEDYPGLRYWNSAPWRTIRAGSGRLNVGAPILSLFLEDEFGRAVSDEIKAQLFGDMQGFWRDLPEDKRLPYTQLGYQTKEAFRTLLEGKYPFLRLCEGHWKVNQLWVNYFKNPTPPSSSNGSKNKAPNPIKEDTPIDVSSSDISDTSILGPKRGHQDITDSEVGPSKKHKGKGVEFHPLRPKPKKISAKMARVSIFSSLLRQISTENYPGRYIVLFLLLCMLDDYTDFISSTSTRVASSVVPETPDVRVRIY